MESVSNTERWSWYLLQVALRQISNEGRIKDLRDKVLETLATCEMAFKVEDKASLRNLHAKSRQLELFKRRKWIKWAVWKYRRYFIHGDQVKPYKIDPVLIEATEEWHHDLFRLARLSWSLPYSQGFGRRMRFLVFDDFTECLIGLIGLQSPPIDLAARDNLFRYPKGKKTQLVNQTLDIYTLGAIPPYSYLLGGKLTALLASSTEVRLSYKYKYLDQRTLIEERHIPSELVALTTTSAYGRSSLYNRLSINGKLIAEPIGYTEGYGTFHLAPLFDDFKDLLIGQGQYINKGYGQGSGVGPHPKWQQVDQALRLLGLSPHISRLHGVKRQVYLFRLIDDLEDYMSGKIDDPTTRTLEASQLADYWRERWMLPRSKRNRDWKGFDVEEWLNKILSEAEG